MSPLPRPEGLDPAPLAVGTLVGLAGLAFLLDPVVGAVGIGPLRVRAVALSAPLLAVGFGLGAVALTRSRRLVRLAHAVAAVGWGLVAVGSLGSGPALLAGIAVLVGGSLFLVAERRRVP